MDKNRKGQEEIVGFVLIVVIVAVVFLVLLGIFIRQDGGLETENKEISQFLGSIGQSTSECAVGYEPNYLKLGDLIESCYSGDLCLSGKKACDVLETELRNVLDASWQVGEGPIKGYEFNSTFLSDTKEEEIKSIKKGECIGSVRGNEESINAEGGVIVYSLKVCY